MDLKQHTRIIPIIKEWHKTTNSSQRTIDSLLWHLRKHMDLPDDFGKIKDIRDLMEYLVTHNLDFQLTDDAVDIILGPMRISKLQENYQFFLQYYDEHQFLISLIKKSIESNVRLRVEPAYSEKRIAMVWLYDPWKNTVYQFYDHQAQLPEELSDTARSFVSIGTYSICKTYTKDDHPFADERYKKIVAQLIQLEQQYPTNI